MSRFYTSDDLIRSIKRKTFIPENQNTFTEEDFLEIATEEMFMGILPRILELHEEYYLDDKDVPLVGGQSDYEIPYRAIGNKIRDVAYLDLESNLFEMTRINVEDISEYQGTFVNTQFRTFFTKNNEVSLFPTVQDSVTGALRFFYFLSPNSLVPEKRAGIITNIDRNTGVITLDKIPSNFSTNILMDFIKQKSPHKIIDYDITPVAISSVNLTVEFAVDDIPDSLTIGDHVMQEGETIIPQIPTELHPLLAQRAAVAILEDLGEDTNLDNARKKLKEMENSVGILIDNRVEGSPTKIVNRNGLLRKAVYGKRYGLRGVK